MSCSHRDSNGDHIRPEGALTDQPRATPWGIKTISIRRALKGRDKGGLHASIASEERDPSHEIEHHVRPFQGVSLPRQRCF
jgi:hypothetical protein